MIIAQFIQIANILKKVYTCTSRVKGGCMPLSETIHEQILVTSDGMLTRATDNVPFNVRARRIVVTAHSSINQSIEISVIVGTTGKLVWRSDTPAMVKTLDGVAWEGGVWTFTDTRTWYTIGKVVKITPRPAPSAVIMPINPAMIPFR
jgi:hypothetical protein